MIFSFELFCKTILNFYKAAVLGAGNHVLRTLLLYCAISSPKSTIVLKISIVAASSIPFGLPAFCSYGMLEPINVIALYSIIHTKGLNIYQGDRLVLKNINFNLNKGEFVFLIGKTGSGKSSLLKTLYGELPCISGQVHVAEFHLNTIRNHQLPFLRRKLGIIFQDFQLLMDRTVEENLSFVLKATGWRHKADIKDKIATVLTKVGLAWASAKMPYQLSGGEQQRIAIARALLNDPVLLLADEPTGNLDPDVANEILYLFAEINAAGTAVLMATHNYDFLERQGGRILKCDQGYLLDHAR
eukprot:gene174-232_t